MPEPAPSHAAQPTSPFRGSPEQAFVTLATCEPAILAEAATAMPVPGGTNLATPGATFAEVDATCTTIAGAIMAVIDSMSSSLGSFLSLPPDNSALPNATCTGSCPNSPRMTSAAQTTPDPPTPSVSRFEELTSMEPCIETAAACATSTLGGTSLSSAAATTAAAEAVAPYVASLQALLVNSANPPVATDGGASEG